jgi:hypothetical protein
MASPALQLTPEQWDQYAQLELLRRKRERSGLSLCDFVPAIGTKAERYQAPVHLEPFPSLFERTEREPLQVLLSVPPRHSKTETILHGVSRRLLRRPDTKIAYISFGTTVAWEKSRRAYDLALRSGVDLAPSHGRPSPAKWRTAAGGCFYATGVGGPLTSLGFDLIIVDDPHKGRTEAESPTLRRKTQEWFSGTAYNRLEPAGSIIVCHTRWHLDDLIGYIAGHDARESLAAGIPRDPAGAQAGRQRALARAMAAGAAREAASRDDPVRLVLAVYVQPASAR